LAANQLISAVGIGMKSTSIQPQEPRAGLTEKSTTYKNGFDGVARDVYEHNHRFSGTIWTNPGNPKT
jgi:hypothetical protein